MNPITAEVLSTLERMGASSKSAIEALRSAETIIREMEALEDNFRDRTEPLLVMGMIYA